MPAYPKNYPFYNWVPKPIGIIILFMFFLPILTVGGTYSASGTEMMSGLGIISEHIQFANFATSIGMAAFCPFLYRLVCIRREKMMCIVGFSLMYIFSYICAKTDSIFLLALCSLFMGFLRMVLMMGNLFTLIKYAGNVEATEKITPGNEPTTGEGWDKLDIERSAAQPAIYLFFMVLGQLGTSLTAWLTYEYEWQYVYYFMMGLLLLCILITFVTMPYHKYATRRFPINLKQFGNASIFCITLTCITYVLTYGKVLDWYDDPTIQWATVGAVVAGILFVYIEVTQRNPYYQFDVLKLRTIRFGFLFYFLLMVLNSSSMFVNVFTGIGMKLDNYQNATLGNWSMLGDFMGGIATKLSDYTILTSDNPRTEDPAKIMEDILKGVKSTNYEVELDRKTAIKKGIEMLKPEDILLILGKGHEDYQIIGHTKIHLDDAEEVENWKKEHNQ